MAAKTLCRVLSAGLCVASALRKGKRRTDCYSVYDGKPLLRFTIGTKADYDDIMDKLVELGCTELGEGRSAELLAICDAVHTTTVAEIYGDKVKVLDKDAGAFYRTNSGVAQGFVEAAGVASDGTMNSYYTAWRDYASNVRRVEDAVANSGGAATLEQIGTTVEGRPIKAVRIRGTGWSSGKSRVVVDFELHAREWIASMSGVYAVEMATQKARNDPSWLAGMELVLIPMANPDGLVYSETTSRMWRKNRARNSGSSCDGVDLNRNWDPDWAGRESTSGNPCSDIYYGPSAFSEPETQAVKSVIDEAPVNVHLDVHSYTELILRPWSYTWNDHPRRTEIDELGEKMLTAINRANGHGYRYGGNEFLYPASGICPDYSTLQGAFGYTYELRPNSSWGGGFAPPASQILPTAEECLAGIYAAIDWAQNPPAPPAPTPAPPSGTWSVSGSGCEMSGNCIQSNNHPSNYGNSEECTIDAYNVDMTVEAFSTESSYDILTVGSTRYSGRNGPPSGRFSGTISWSSDYSVTQSGWKLCKA